MIPGYLTLRSPARHNESVGPTGTWGGQLMSTQSIQQSIQILVHSAPSSVPTSHHSPSRSPLSCPGCVLAMIHLTRQHFIRAFREKRGFCHFPESFPRPGAGYTPLASPRRLPSTTLPSDCSTRGRGEGGGGGESVSLWSENVSGTSSRGSKRVQFSTSSAEVFIIWCLTVSKCTVCCRSTFYFNVLQCFIQLNLLLYDDPAAQRERDQVGQVEITNLTQNDFYLSGLVAE